MIVKHSISVVFPVYNEEDNIKITIEKSAELLQTQEIFSGYEIVAVNDGSTDNTSRILNQLSSGIPHLKVVTHYLVILFMNAEGQFDISDIFKAAPYIKDYDMIIG